MPERKELHFFDDETLFRSWPVCYDHYHRHFSIRRESIVIGEATPIYMYWKPVSKRVKQYNPQMKLIFLLRNPIERAYSHYIMQRNRQVEKLPFSVAIRLDKLRCLGASPHQRRVYSYVDRGYYSSQVTRMLREFPREQMLFLKTEELRESHQSALNRVCEFLGVERWRSSAHRVLFSNRYEDMSADDRRFLSRLYRREISTLEALLGWDCSDWLRCT